jgi:hypothetical protein
MINKGRLHPRFRRFQGLGFPLARLWWTVGREQPCTLDRTLMVSSSATSVPSRSPGIVESCHPPPLVIYTDRHLVLWQSAQNVTGVAWRRNSIEHEWMERRGLSSTIARIVGLHWVRAQFNRKTGPESSVGASYCDTVASSGAIGYRRTAGDLGRSPVAELAPGSPTSTSVWRSADRRTVPNSITV